MPLKDYKCDNCGHVEQDVWHVNPYPNPMACPRCDEWMQPQIGSVELRFKGDGWTVSDYKESSGDDNGGSDDG